MAVIGPSTALARIDAFAAPVANSRSSRASRIVPTPIVRARLGTLPAIAAEHARILLEREGRERLVSRAGHERRQRFVEADVARLADAQELHINPSCLSYELFVVVCLRAQIGRHAIRNVRIGKVDIHPAEQVMIHVIAVGVFVLGRYADVFVQVERTAP